MPLEVRRLSRAKRSRIYFEHPESAPDFGYCVEQKSTILVTRFMQYAPNRV